MSVYTDMIRSDPESRARMRIDAGHDLQPAQPPRDLLLDRRRRARARRSSRRRSRSPRTREVIEHHLRGPARARRLRARPAAAPAADGRRRRRDRRPCEARASTVEREAAVIDESRVREFEPERRGRSSGPNEREPRPPGRGGARRSPSSTSTTSPASPGTASSVLAPVKRHRPVAARARDPRRAVGAPAPAREPDPPPLVARQLAAGVPAGADADGQGGLGAPLPLHLADPAPARSTA